MIVLHLAPISQALILALVLVGAYGVVNSDFKKSLALDVRRVVREGEYFRLLSASAVHDNWAQLVIHVAVLAAIAPLFEVRFGAAALLMIYLAGAIVGALWLLLENWRRQDARALGATGASMALVIAFALIAPTLQLRQVAWMPGVVAVGAFLGYSVYAAIRWRIQTGGFPVLIGGALVAVVIVSLAWPDRVRQLPASIAHHLSPSPQEPSTIDTITIRP